MISGIVSANREAVLRLEVLDAEGNARERNVVVDTGFDRFLTLPPEFITLLDLPWLRFGRATLGDGSETSFDIYEAIVLWDGQSRTVPVYALDAEPLLGMSLMYGYELILPVLDGATFTLRSVAAI